jgi:hypothetical protein
MVQSTTNVAAASPKTTGGLLYAPIGTPIPTDETTALNAAFKAAGYVGEDGIAPSGDSASLTDIIAWGGDIVASIEESKSIERFEFTLIEYFNPDVNALLFGSANVVTTAATASVGTKLAIKSTGYSIPLSRFVFDMNYKGKLIRYVVPNGQLLVTAELPLVHTDATGYECELTCLPDATGVRTYRYLANTDITA